MIWYSTAGLPVVCVQWRYETGYKTEIVLVRNWLDGVLEFNL